MQHRESSPDVELVVLQRKAKAKPERNKFTAKQRKLMIGDLEKLDYQNHVDSAIRPKPHFQPASSLHFILYMLHNRGKGLATRDQAFLDIYRSHMKGKLFANLKQEWMRHIDDYFTSENVEPDDEASLTIKGECKRLWDKDAGHSKNTNTLTMGK